MGSVGTEVVGDGATEVVGGGSDPGGKVGGISFIVLLGAAWEVNVKEQERRGCWPTRQPTYLVIKVRLEKLKI